MNSFLVVTHLLNGLLMIAMPILLGIFLARRFKLGWRLWWIGATTVILSQVGHIPFNIALGLLFERGFLPIPPETYQLAFTAIIAGLSAGVWEESFRYGAYRWWAKDARTWSKGLMLGTGWGGAEAIILGILVLVNYAVMMAVQFGDLSTVFPEDQFALLGQQATIYWSLPWHITLLGALERASTITIQISLSIIVLQVFTRRNIAWLFLAIGWHALFDVAAVYLVQTYEAIITEAVLAGMAIISLLIIFALRQPEPPQEEPEAIHPPTDFAGADIDTTYPTAENLEESKYLMKRTPWHTWRKVILAN